MKTSGLLLSLLLLTGTVLQAQKSKETSGTANPVLIEKIERAHDPGDYTIPYSKYKFANGLTLIVSEDHSDPIVHVDVTYHVGSSREDPGKSGFAHFFEHMMFEGSKHIGRGKHFAIVNKAGGTMNGNTTEDRTRYFETLPKNYLETALWLESDRMGFLLDSVTKKKFENQRATVKNEKGQRIENRPYGMLGEVVDKNLYPFGHPYSWPTIGYVPDLNRVTVDDLKKFFLRWYGPNNAILTVAGDVNTEDVINLVQKYFSLIPKGPDVKRQVPEYFALKSDRYVSFEDNVRFPRLTMVYPTVPNFHEDEAALDMLTEILGGGKSSLLYQNFVKTEKAVSASASHETGELAGKLSIDILANPGTKLSEMEALVKSTYEDFLKRGVTDDDLERIIGKKTSEAIFALESVANKANLLSDYEYLLGNPNNIRNDIRRYSKVTKKDIMRVFDIYIKNAHPLIVSVYPKGKKDLIARHDNFVAGGDSSKLKYSNYDTIKPRAVAETFKRKRQPKPGPSPVVTIPSHAIFDHPGMMKIITIVNHEVPDIYVQINIKAGIKKQLPGQDGTAYLVMKMMQEGTLSRTAEQVNDELDKLGSVVRFDLDQEYIHVTVHCLTKNYEATMALVTEMILHPKVDRVDFERVKKETIQLIANQSVRADALANNEFNHLIYGQGNPLGMPIMGSKQTVEGIQPEQIKMYINENIKADNTSAVITGDVKDSDRQSMFTPLLIFEISQSRPDMLTQRTPAIEKTKIYLVNKDNAAQSEIRMGYLAMPYDATGEFFKANVMNYPLGGSFNSRLNITIREQKGYTYGIRSGFDGGHIPGPFLISTGVRANITDSALMDILAIVKKYADKGMTRKELKFTKKSYIEREALKYETNMQKSMFGMRIIEYNVPEDFSAQQARIIKKLKKKELKKFAKEHLPVDKMVIVVVGDAAKLKDKLSKIGYDIVDVPVENNDQSGQK